MHYKSILLEKLKNIDHKSKYIAQANYNKKIPLFKQKVITRMMNHNNKIFSFNLHYVDINLSFFNIS
jgi:hypothetical protein